MKIIFFGSDDFAARHLKALCDSAHEILACVTRPARARGRHLEMTPTIVRDLALQNNIPVFEPETLEDLAILKALKDLNAELFAVVAYGHKLPEEIIGIPKLFCINVHGSLLPKYRGAAPINWAIINGEKESGATIFKINKSFDAGEIISQKSIPIEDDDTSVTLRSKVCQLGVELLLETLEKISRHQHTLTKQDLLKVTLAPRLTRGMGNIDWNKSALEIHNCVRGLLPWPAAYTQFKGKMLKVLETEMSRETTAQKPGEVLEITGQGFWVSAGHGKVHVKRVHLESSRPMEAKSFVRGHKITIGFQFS